MYELDEQDNAIVLKYLFAWIPLSLIYATLFYFRGV